MKAPDEFVKLTIFRDSAGRARWVRALKATADFYGWTDTFERWVPNGGSQNGSYTFIQKPHRDSKNNRGGGKRLRICRSKSRSGNPAGLTNEFTISNSCRLIDLAELAHFTKGDWHWMSTPTGERVTRDRWEAMYDAGTQKRWAGLVSD